MLTLLRRVLVVVLVGLACLPVSAWIRGGAPMPEYDGVLSVWIGGVAALGLAAAMLSWTAIPDLGARILRQLGAHPAGGLVPAGLVLAGCLVFAVGAFGLQPLHVDELTQAYQARVLAGGHLWEPSPRLPEFTSSLLVADHAGRRFGQFPPGWPALLAIGQWAGVPWLLGPLCAVLLVWCWMGIARAVGAGDAAAAGTGILIGLSPWILALGGSWMNHLPATALLSAGALALCRAMEGAEKRRWAMGAGAAFGMAATMRPLDALCFLLPAGLWLLARARRQRLPLLGFAGGAAVPVTLLLLYNLATTGAPLQLGYEAMWGPTHRLGFHPAPWGPDHTPALGLANIAWYLWQMQDELLAAPLPALLAPLGALLLARRLHAGDRYLLAAAGLLLTGYLAYWHRGAYLGPRFLFPLAPLALLWTARLPSVLVSHGWPRAARWSAMLVALALTVGMAWGTPARYRLYRGSYPMRRWDAAAAVRAAGLQDALILVREPWSAQVVARLTGRGVPRRDALRLVATVDICALHLAVQNLEQFEASGPAALEGLLPLQRDSALLTPLPQGADTTLRALPGAPWPAPCLHRLAEDRAGTAPLLPLLLAAAGSNRFVRDLQERTHALLKAEGARTVYQVVVTAGPDGRPRYRLGPVRPDSAVAVWRAEARTGGLAGLRAMGLAR